MNLTENFQLSEFSCKDGKGVPLELLANVKELAENLQVLRDEVGVPITITSGYRTPAYNKKIGGAKNSQHCHARAADIKVQGLTPKEVKETIERLIKEGKMKQGGIGVYPSWTHYDTFYDGKNPRRW
jgi:uncharacterized protein YcbK (DUF882 family)